jgi:hypothetical protein
LSNNSARKIDGDSGEEETGCKNSIEELLSINYVTIMRMKRMASPSPEQKASFEAVLKSKRERELQLRVFELEKENADLKNKDVQATPKRHRREDLDLDIGRVKP